MLDHIIIGVYGVLMGEISYETYARHLMMSRRRSLFVLGKTCTRPCTRGLKRIIRHYHSIINQYYLILDNMQTIEFDTGHNQMPGSHRRISPGSVHANRNIVIWSISSKRIAQQHHLNVSASMLTLNRLLH